MSLLPNVVAVVKFKKLANELTDSEFHLFLSKISKKIGKETILKLLCSQFMKSTSIDNQQLLINDLIKIISNIIQSRKIKQMEQKVNTTKLDQIPSSLIGKIASYLEQTEYALFCRLNRTIFVNCNTPNTLKQIKLNKINANYSSIDLQNYPQIIYLVFKLHQFHQFPMNKTSISVSNRLETLFMKGTECTNIDIQRFMNQKYLNLNNLKKACFARFKNEFTSFCKLLSQFKMIQHLSLFFMNIDGQINTEKLVQLFPNLTGLLCMDVNIEFIDALITEYGSNLECLSLCPRSPGIIDCDHINFSKLKRFLAAFMSSNTMNNILKTAKGLREIVFVPKGKGRSLMSTDEIKESIQKFIFNQSSLEFLYIPTKPENLELICNSIETALYKTNKRKRENFEIGFHIDCRNKFDAQDFMVNISRIIDKLNASNTNNFMISFECTDYGEFDLKEMSKAINDYIEFTPSVKLIKATKLGFIITNKHCKMHRHHQWWNDCPSVIFL